MTQRSIAWDGTSQGDHGPYGADDWQEQYRQVFGDQVSPSTKGPFYSDEQDSLFVTEHDPTPNMSVDVGAGAALVDGVVYWNDAVVNLAIQAADPTLNRIDRVICRLDDTAQTVRLAVKVGMPSASPAPPTLQTDRNPYFEIPLFQVYVAATVTEILNANLTDERDWINYSPPIPAFEQLIVEAPDNPPNYLGYEIDENVTTLTDVDATNLAITLETHGGDVELHFEAATGCILNAGTLAFDISVDGTYLRDLWSFPQPNNGTFFVNCVQDDTQNQSFTAVVEGLSAGSHTFKIAWRCVWSGGTIVFYVSNSWPIIFSAREFWSD